MCSLLINKTADSQLNSLPAKHKQGIEKKFSNFAGDSNVAKPGILDLPENHLHSLPSDLKDIRRRRSGRHRVFYVGNFSACSFRICFIKEFKKKGVNDEHDSSFHDILKTALRDTAAKRTLRLPDPPPPGE